MVERKVPTEQEIYDKAISYFAEEEAKGDFDPLALLTDAKQLKQKYDRRFGWIKFGELTYKESHELAGLTDKEERTVKTIWKMLSKAYPNLTEEDVRNWPVQKVARLGKILAERITDFLQNPA